MVILLRAEECRLCCAAVQAVPGYCRSAGCAYERVVQALQAPRGARRRRIEYSIWNTGWTILQ
jgi:hypothetical protein